MENKKEQNEPKEVEYLISEIISEKKMSVTDLAKKSNLERKSIYNIMNGESDPNICTLVRISKALNVKVDELIKY